MVTPSGNGPRNTSPLHDLCCIATLNLCVAQNCDRGEKLVEPQAANGAGAKGAVVAAFFAMPAGT